MNDKLQEFREQYPEYDDMSDAELARALHRKFYSDMDYEDFAERLGLPTERAAAQQRLAAGGGSAVGDFVHQAAEGATLGQAEKFAGVAAGQLPNQFARPDDPRFQNRDARREAAAAAFQQRTDDLSLLAPEASAAAIAAPAALAGIGGASLLPRLGPAVGAIRGLGGRVAGNPILRRLARGALTGVGASGGGLATFRLLRGMLD